ncbi:hypothetical protein B0T24DRAFT_253827 [Lasiosphaeria ovina]|uniref:Uncharacterized protein n=1 Tax=Lasiosphaeria ovina TaxID=92902 RepID=A0AAE0N758_9PEZI|nr:hypothetical protein B0T24DRAFT_253827 [Lasiosphaeria ovina]
MDGTGKRLANKCPKFRTTWLPGDLNRVSYGDLEIAILNGARNGKGGQRNTACVSAQLTIPVPFRLGYLSASAHLSRLISRQTIVPNNDLPRTIVLKYQLRFQLPPPVTLCCTPTVPDYMQKKVGDSRLNWTRTTWEFASFLQSQNCRYRLSSHPGDGNSGSRPYPSRPSPISPGVAVWAPANGPLFALLIPRPPTDEKHRQTQNSHINGEKD